MKKLLSIFICVLIYSSCASSQNAAINAEAKEKVERITQQINLTASQVRKMTAIEKEFLSATKKLTPSTPSYKNQLNTLNDRRTAKIKAILSRAQYLKFDVIENDRIKKVPIRAN